MTDAPSSPSSLKQALGLPLLTLYGLGTVLGAGIYVLVGEVAGRAGLWAPLSFLLAATLSALTAFTFAELAGRFPKSAGEAVYVREGFGVRWLALVVGLLVASAGIISSAAIAQGFAGYLHTFITVPDVAVEIILISMLTLLAIWGIAESVTIAAVLTVIEAGALVLVLVLGLPVAFTETPLPAPPGDLPLGIMVLSGAVLAFYAFIGFEDMVNVAEEVRDAPRTIGRAIAMVVVVTTVLYVGVVWVAIHVVPVADLSASSAPMALIFGRLTGWPPGVMALVAMLAVVNGALIQIIMAARVLYGLAAQGDLPKGLAKVSTRTHTPVLATLLVGAAVMTAALLLPLATLAEITSFMILIVFTLVNGALLMIKRRGPAPEGAWRVPWIIPALGMVSSAGFALVAGWQVLAG